MLERILYEQYKLHCEKRIKVGNYDGFVANGNSYIVAPIAPLGGKEMTELTQYMHLLYNRGDSSFAPIERTIRGQLFFAGEETYYAVLRLPEKRNRMDDLSIGRELGIFHKRTIGYPYAKTSLNYYLSWKTFWLRRMEQLENWYEECKKESSKGDMDNIFIETFPYVLGLTENALQYIAEIEREEGVSNFPPPTICHERFSADTWNCGGNYVKLPTKWIVDQPTRDIAEFIRKDMYKENGIKNNCLRFINDYEKQMPLSKAAWRFLYARLLFPVDYYQYIEGYYSATTNETKQKYASLLRENLSEMVNYERNLMSFYDDVGLPSEQLQIPIIEWMKS
ncbi:spore coat protein YutH [Lottiidibacillus patelloidae]|uniref:Spore coat protein YutH n=1 Tax=Lottiidibacillus patelloidae TaxID=2670334 RepID=A0A263BQE9_9BACI|nr:spore coat protein YutH [Lottiidibacillus patelloidae]OZM55961.1 spore coat protein YutH [Lottiidibacillus patelloidae]